MEELVLQGLAANCHPDRLHIRPIHRQRVPGLRILGEEHLLLRPLRQPPCPYPPLEGSQYSGHLLPWVTAHSELFFNGERMVLARYPNDKHTYTGKVVNPGTRIRTYAAIYWTNNVAEIEDYIGEKLESPVFNADKLRDKLSQWKDAKDIWVNIWANEYADMNLKISGIDHKTNNISLAQPVNYALASNRHARFFNILEEIDRPGEWYLDRDTKIAYLYPPSDLCEAAIELSILEEPVIKVIGASNLRFEGIAVESSCGHGIQLIGGDGNVISNCSIKNIGINGIFIGHFAKEFYGPDYFFGCHV